MPNVLHPHGRVERALGFAVYRDHIGSALVNDRFRHLPLYVGGFMGPFGTVVIVPMFPELRESFDASSSQVGLGYSLYLIPFAILLLVSGTLGERWGRRRTVRSTYLLYTVASIGCALAPTLGVFVAARAVQGVSNAFITPLLLAGLAETVPKERFGRVVGIYSSFQALGGGLGPIVGGVAADTNWRLAFFGTAIVAGLLALAPPTGEPRKDAAAPTLKPLLKPQMLLLGVAFFFAAAGPIGIGVIVGVAARDVLDLSGTVAGLVLFGGSLSALTLGPIWGRVLDRLGTRKAVAVSTVLATAVTAILALPTSALALAIVWFVGAGLVSFMVVVFQALGATIMPENRGGALSFLLAFRFMGHAIGPIVLIPMIDTSARTAYLVAGAVGLVTIAIVTTREFKPDSPSRSLTH